MTLTKRFIKPETLRRITRQDKDYNSIIRDGGRGAPRMRVGGPDFVEHWPMYNATTHSIRVSVEPIYLDDQSAPEDDYYVWSYKVIIENESASTVQIRHRHWRITDAHGRTQEIHGEGVVGEQPVLAPGESFEYTSGAPLSTPSGIMAGFYQMTTAEGEVLDVIIPPFSLDSPYGRRTVN